MPYKRYSKSESHIAYEFSGSEESAKELIRWVKDALGEEKYHFSELRRMSEKTMLGSDQVVDRNNEAFLRIFVEGEVFDMPTGSILIHNEEGPVRFRVTYPFALSSYKEEEIVGNLSED